MAGSDKPSFSRESLSRCYQRSGLKFSIGSLSQTPPARSQSRGSHLVPHLPAYGLRGGLFSFGRADLEDQSLRAHSFSLELHLQRQTRRVPAEQGLLGLFQRSEASAEPHSSVLSPPRRLVASTYPTPGKCSWSTIDVIFVARPPKLGDALPCSPGRGYPLFVSQSRGLVLRDGGEESQCGVRSVARRFAFIVDGSIRMQMRFQRACFNNLMLGGACPLTLRWPILELDRSRSADKNLKLYGSFRIPSSTHVNSVSRLPSRRSRLRFDQGLDEGAPCDMSGLPGNF